MEELTYEQTVELEKNVQLKNKAEEIYDNFLKNIKLEVKRYKGGRFCHWNDSYNATFFYIDSNSNFRYKCEFLHETYDVLVTPSGIFDALKRKYRGVEHLESAVSIK